MSEIDDLINIILNYQPTKKELLLFIRLHNEDYNIKNYSNLSVIDLHKLVLNYINKFYKIVKIKKIKKSKKSKKLKESQKSKIKAYEDFLKIYEESQKEYIPIDIRQNPYQTELTEALEGLQKLQDEKYNIYKPKPRGKPNKPRQPKLKIEEEEEEEQPKKPKGRPKKQLQPEPEPEPEPQPINDIDVIKKKNTRIDWVIIIL